MKMKTDKTKQSKTQSNQSDQSDDNKNKPDPEIMALIKEIEADMKNQPNIDPEEQRLMRMYGEQVYS